MLKRAGRLSVRQRLLLAMASLAFAATAAVHGFLAGTMTEWWPAVLAVILALAALFCAATAARPWWPGRRDLR